MSIETRLFVSNLPENIEQKDLQSVFSAYGEVINVDLKSKSTTPDDQKKFAFITLTASNYDIESCIKHFSNENYKGNKLYVTRARESFLERLQREREQAKNNEIKKNSLSECQNLPKVNPVINLEEKLNPRKRKLIDSHMSKRKNDGNIKVNNSFEVQAKPQIDYTESSKILSGDQKKKIDSEKKRMESLKMKRQEFNKMKMIIKTGLTGVDKVQNKRILFSDLEDNATEVANCHTSRQTQKTNLFDENDSGDEVNFEIKEQFEGKKGQKVLDLQSRYKSDKRFILDERFIEDKESDNEDNEAKDNEEIEVEQTDEKIKQLNILQDVLGVAIKSRSVDQDNKKTKNKLGMLRFDPSQPEHAKFVVPMEEKQEPQKKSKKKLKDKKEENKQEAPVVETVEVSKDQFYKVSETLKETIAQPSSFSLRSLFAETAKSDDSKTGPQDQETDYISIAPTKKTKVKNPLDPGEKNPFVYDSSDSETEDIENDIKADPAPVVTENKAVWKENLFFSQNDKRLKDGLEFFNKSIETDIQKERRELKSLMKKRIYNKERKNQMFQKKIGGRKKTMKKSLRKRK